MVFICSVQATSSSFDALRCDVATLIQVQREPVWTICLGMFALKCLALLRTQLRRHVDTGLRPERDELRNKVAAQKKVPNLLAAALFSCAAFRTSGLGLSLQRLAAMPGPSALSSPQPGVVYTSTGHVSHKKKVPQSVRCVGYALLAL